MGIHGLTKLLSDEAPNCMKEVDLDSLTGRKVAIDASMAMYQFLVSYRDRRIHPQRPLWDTPESITLMYQIGFERIVGWLFHFSGARLLNLVDQTFVAQHDASEAKLDWEVDQLLAVPTAIAVRSGGEGQAQMLTNEAGEVTSHIQGMFNRTIRMLSKGVKPCYIFDGKPPDLKGGELAKRKEKRTKAEADLKTATEADEKSDVDKFSKRLVRVTSDHNDDCKTLLRLMGVPVLTAPSEAEAQCAALAREGVVYGAATEDMDALTFKTPKLLRRMTFSGTQQPILEVDYTKLLQGLDLSHEKFVDLCILCGCDYTGSIKGIGPKKALALIRQHGTIEEIIKHLNPAKYPLPDDWLEPSERAENRNQGRREAKARKEARAKEQAKEEAVETTELAKQERAPDRVAENPVGEDSAPSTKREREEGNDEDCEEDIDDTPPMYRQARRLFLEPDVEPAGEIKLKWTDPDEAGLLKLLVEDKGFNAERVASGIAKLKAARKNVSQKRMDSFFSIVPNPSAGTKKPSKEKGAPGAKGKAAGAKGKAAAAPLKSKGRRR